MSASDHVKPLFRLGFREASGDAPCATEACISEIASWE